MFELLLTKCSDASGGEARRGCRCRRCCSSSGGGGGGMLLNSEQSDWMLGFKKRGLIRGVALSLGFSLGLAPLSHAQRVTDVNQDSGLLTRVEASLVDPSTQLPDPLSQLLDPTVLIDGLRRHGLEDLLGYYARTQAFDANQSSEANIAKQLVEVAQQRLIFENKSLPQTKRAEAIEQAVKLLLKVSQQESGHPHQPVWYTDIAEMLLLNQLTIHQKLALDFVVLGVPTEAQLMAYRQAVSEAAWVMQLADEALYELQGTLPMQSDYQSRWVATGLAKRLFDDYGQELLPFYLGLSAFYASRLPEQSPYWQRYQKLPDHALDINNERFRLLQLAEVKLSAFVRRNPSLSPGYIRTAQVTRALALADLGQRGLALRLLDGLIAQNGDDLIHVRAQLAKAQVLGFDGKLQQGIQVAASYAQELAERHPDWLYQRLLVADAEHRLLLRLAQSRGNTTEQIAAAYAPYDRLRYAYEKQASSRGKMAGGDVSTGGGGMGAVIDALLADRWMVSVEKARDLNQVPARVRLAVSRFAARRGYAQASQAGEAGKPVLTDEALRLLTLSEKVSASLLAEGALSGQRRALGGVDVVQARLGATHDWAVSLIGQKPHDLQTRLKATAPMVDMAAAYPSYAESEVLIRDAVRWLLQLHQAAIANEDGKEKTLNQELDLAVRQACEVLFNQYGLTETADNMRLYYASAVLFNQDQDDWAVANLLSQVPLNHRDYFDAQALRLKSLWRLAQASQKSGGGGGDGGAMRMVVQVATTVEQMAEPKAATDQAAHRAWVAAVTALAQVEIAQGREDLATARIQRLNGGDGSGGGDVKHLSDWLAGANGQIDADALTVELIALAKSDQFEKLSQRVDALLTRDSESSEAESQRSSAQVAAAIASVIQRFLDEIDALRVAGASAVGNQAQQIEEDIVAKAKVAHTLASQLTLYAADAQTFNAAQKLNYALIEAKTAWLMGDARQAVSVMRQVQANYGESLDVVHALAEALYHTGHEPFLIEAFGLFERIDQQFKDDSDPPEVWWGSRLRMIQIIDQIKPQESRSIVRNILQLQQRDGLLGGSLYRPQFGELLAKHQALVD